MYIDKLDNMVYKCNNTYHITIVYNKKCNDKDPKFQVSDHVRISKRKKKKKAKSCTPNWWEEVFVIKKIKNTVPWRYVISDLKDEEIVGMFYEKKLKTKQLRKI